MSDCFDHALDAYDSLCNSDYWIDRPIRRSKLYTKGEDCDYISSHKSVKSSYDPLFYHIKRSGLVFVYENDKSFLLEDDKGKFWVSKKLCRKVDKQKGILYIWRGFDAKYVED